MMQDCKKLSSIQWNVTNTYWFWSPSHIWMTWWEDSMSRDNWEGNERSDEGLRLHTLWRQRKPTPWCMWRSFWSHRLAGTAEMMTVRLRARRCGWKEAGLKLGARDNMVWLGYSCRWEMRVSWATMGRGKIWLPETMGPRKTILRGELAVQGNRKTIWFVLYSVSVFPRKDTCI